MQNNQIIVDGRDTGKTTYLLNEIDRLHQEGVNIVVMDSATEHEEKSLLKKTCNNINESVVIDMRDPNGIVIDKVGIQYFVENFMNYFPFAEVVKNRNKTICFDLSYFLEKGHDEYDRTNSIELYNYYRSLYNLEKGKMTQEKLAELADVSTALIANVESDKINQGISVFTLWKISKALEIPVENLFNGIDKDNHSLRA